MYDMRSCFHTNCGRFSVSNILWHFSCLWLHDYVSVTLHFIPHAFLGVFSSQFLSFERFSVICVWSYRAKMCFFESETISLWHQSYTAYICILRLSDALVSCPKVLESNRSDGKTTGIPLSNKQYGFFLFSFRTTVSSLRGCRS